MKKYKDKEKRRAYLAEWKLANADRLKPINNKRAREWRLANPDKSKQKCKKDWERYKEKKRDAVRKWRLTHKEELREKYKKYKEINKEKSRNATLLRIYGITAEDYNNILDKQGGVCAICKGDNAGKRFHVDHCHILDIIRGLLCNSCNSTLGHAKDSIAILQEAIRYLERNYHDAAKIVQNLRSGVRTSPVERGEQIRLGSAWKQGASPSG